MSLPPSDASGPTPGPPPSDATATPEPLPVPARVSRPHEADGQWHRVHPLTPAVKSWQAIVVVLVFLAQDWGQDLARGERSVLSGRADGQGLGRIGGGWLVGGVGLLGLVVAAAVGFAVLSWRMTRYRVTEDALELHHGVVSRSQRRARLDRLQAVDVVQPLVARVVGLARLSVEVAGGSGSKIQLVYLTQDQAQRLRNHLLARAAGVHYETEQAPEAPEHQVLDVPIDRLIGSLALSGGTLGLVGFAAVALVGFGLTRSPGLMAALFPVTVGLSGMLWQQFSRGFGFRAATSPDGLRLRHGLLEHRTQTVPPGRVQAIRINQPLLWRRTDWWRVQVNIAGYAAGVDSEQLTETVLLPVGTPTEAMAVVAFVLPDLGIDTPDGTRAVVTAAMTGSGPELGFVTCPPQARWLDPLAWRRSGFLVTGQVLLIRRGRLLRQVDIVPHARTQSFGVRQAWLQRRLGLASFRLHSTPGPISPVVAHLSTADAAALLSGQSLRARQARATAGPERWMDPPG